MSGVSSETQQQKLSISLRKPWVTGLLVTVTFSLYLLRWFYLQARQVKQLGRTNTWPWLWVLVPLVALSMPFAMRRLYAYYQTVAEQENLSFKDNGGNYGGLAFLFFILIGASEQVPPAYELLALILSLAGLGYLFARIEEELNTLLSQSQRIAIDDLEGFDKYLKNGGASIFATLGLVVFAGLIYLEVEQFSRQPLVAGERWYHPEKQFSIRFEDGWRVAEVGSFSDGSAAAEFAYTSEETLLIFDQQNADFDTLMANRREEILANDSRANCSEKRYLTGSELIRVAELVCNSKNFDEPRLTQTRVFDSGKNKIELYADVSAASFNLELAERRMDQIARSFRFEPVPGKK